MEKQIGYKAMSKDMKCRDFQFELGKIYKIDGGLKLCSNGFHFCKQGVDVLVYYSNYLNQRYFEVEAYGEILTDGNKSVCSQIKIIKEVSMQEIIRMFHICSSTTGDLFHSSTTGDKSHSSTTGNMSHSSTTGNSSHSSTTGNGSYSSTTGDRSHSSTTGYLSHSSTTGYSSHSSTTGNGSYSNTTGYESHSSTTGYESHSSTTGDMSHSSTTGYNSISSAIGVKNRAMAKNGWIIITDWRHENKWEIHNILSKKVGQTYKGKKIKSNTWYWFDNGELKSKKNE